MAKRFGNVAIIGVGLIGGSIGLAARERKLADQVIGIGRRQSSLDTAMSVGAITDATTDIAKGVENADLVIVCTPVGKVVEHIRAAAKTTGKNAIITDAASTKANIVSALDGEVAAGLRFVGSHPLAGSHLTGPAAATADLFCDRRIVLTPSEHNAQDDVKTVRDFWQAIGANTYEMKASEHDRLVAAASHLPHIAASAVAGVTTEEQTAWVGSGWRDTTRIAAGSPEIWQDILQGNRDEILAVLAKFADRIDSYRAAIEADDIEKIFELLDQGRQRRDAVGS